MIPRVRGGTALLGILVVGVLVLSACGGGGDDEDQPTPTPTATGTVETQPAPTPIPTAQGQPSGDLAADFSIFVYQGEDVLGSSTLSFNQILGQGKPVALNFWAGVCPPCRAEMPDLQEVYNEFGDRVVFFGLDVGPFFGLGSRDDGRELLEELMITYPAGSTEDATVVRSYQVLGMPSTFFIKPNGEIFSKWTGLIKRGDLAEQVQELIEAS